MVWGSPSCCSLKSSLVRSLTICPCLSCTVANTFTTLTSDENVGFSWPASGKTTPSTSRSHGIPERQAVHVLARELVGSTHQSNTAGWRKLPQLPCSKILELGIAAIVNCSYTFCVFTISASRIDTWPLSL